MFKSKKQAFTLVELIVVITILAILGTIAFLSFQGYSKDARNSARASDLRNIEKVLTLNKLKTGQFILPTTGVEITYSGSEVWTQGSFGENTRIKLGDRGNMSKVPVDPLTQNEYTYSVLNTRTEMSIAAVMEGEYGLNTEYNDTILNQTYAAGQIGTIYIVGNYNGRIAKTSSGTTTYILAVPTIISGDIALTDIIDLINSKKLAFNSSGILPSTYTEGVFNNNLPTGNIVNTGSILVFSGSIQSLSDSTEQEVFINNLQDAYSGTTVSNLSQIEEILNISGTDQTLLTQNIIKDNILPKLEIDINNNGGNGNNYNSNQFVSTWNTSITAPGGLTTNEYQIKLPLISSGSYNFIVNWGDNSTDTITTWNQAEVTHTYTNTGIYDIIITGEINGFSFPYTLTFPIEPRDSFKLLDIKQWGSDFRFGNNGGYFSSCHNLTGFTATDTPNLDGTTNMGYMFSYTSSFNQDISSWDFSNVTNMSAMFLMSSSFNQDISGWDISNVTNMNNMFNQATSFNQDIGGWDVSNVETMNSLFYKATSFNQDISGWNVSNVTDMGRMFSYTPFNQDISGWNVSNVTDMERMFMNTPFNQDISGWDVSNITDMNNMFNGATSFNQDISGWDVSNVTNIQGLFRGATSFNQDIGGWDVSNIDNINWMFNGATSFNQDISGWDVSNVINMVTTFAGATSFNQDIGGWDVSNVTNMDNMFRDTSFDQDISGWNVSNVTAHSGFDGNTPASWTSLEKPSFP